MHGDDFTSSGTESELRWLVQEFEKKYITKVRGIVGPDSHDLRSMTVLNRILEWKSDRITIEADPRHVDMIIKGIGLVNGKVSDVVGSEVKQSEGEEKLCKEDAFKFRSLAARCNFLSMDRLDLQYACKEICHRMSSPRNWMLLKKLARYLVKHRRIAIDFRFQNDANFVDGYSDSDYAGCKDTRKSTSGGCMMIGTHTIRSRSSTQAVVAMSSGQAEVYAVVRCVCELLGLQGLLRDLGMPMHIRCFTDSSAARGVAMRRGVGKIKHFETKTLWVQDQVDRGIVKINKISGSTNPADIMTKYISGERIKMLLNRLGMTEYSGRHHLAPQLQGNSDDVTFLVESCGVQMIDSRTSPASAANDEYHLCPRGSVGNESP